MRLFLVLVLNLAFLFGCHFVDSIVHKKHDSDSPSIVGIWELRHVSGGMVPDSSYLPGNGHLLNFTPTNYQKYSNGLVVKSGQYSVVKEKFFDYGEVMDRIIYDQDTTTYKEFFQISDERLIIFSGGPIASDGWESVYERHSPQAID